MLKLPSPFFKCDSIKQSILIKLTDFTQYISADSGPEKPENPNLETETRQTRTRKIVKIPKPDKPEPENETRGYPMYFYRQKTGKISSLNYVQLHIEVVFT